MERAYATLTVKAVDEEQRVIEGLASTPRTDRMEDIVEPLGAEFSLPLPFLMHHDSRKPVGHVLWAKPNKQGIPVRVKFARVDEPGPVRDRIEEAWQDIKHGLVRGLSIGFKAIESADIDGTWGRRFTKWEWLELSGVTIPANADASIATIKQYADGPAARGTGSVRLDSTPPGASGIRKSANPKRERGAMFNIADKIKDLEATRQAKQARMLAIEEGAANEGRTKDESEREEFTELKGDIQAIDEGLKDLHDMQALIRTARPVEDTKSLDDPRPGNGRPTTTVRVESPKLDKGIRFARVVKALWRARDEHRDIEVVVRSLYPDDVLVQKATVAAASTGGTTWGDQLVGTETTVFADFAEFLRPSTIVGRFGTGGIPSLRNVPFRTPLISQTTGGSGYWVGEGQPKPLTSFAFARTTLEPRKVANIAVATREILRSSSPSADGIIRDSLAGALRERLDIDFIVTTNAGGAATPASVTNAATSYAASGTGTADNIRLDVRSLFQGFIDADNPPTTGVWVMSSGNALALSLLVNALGQPEFSGIGMSGGTFFGLPVITSEHVPSTIVVLMNASDIYLGDEGGIRIDMSTEASLQMVDQDDATNNSLTPTASTLVSLWQTNSVGFLAEREINWAVRRASAVQVLTGVAWGGAVTEATS